MDDIIIREVKKSDFPMVQKLVKELYDTLEVKEGMDEHLNQDKFYDIIQESKTHVLVAEINRVVVGYLTLNFNKALLDIGATAIIDEFIVSKSYRGKGVGRKLVNSAIEKCKQIGCSEIGVGTEFGNIRAKEFYKACGFKEIGVIFEKVLG